MMEQAQQAFLQVTGGMFVLGLLGLAVWIFIGAMTHED